jgi:hypothetical protein
LQDYRARTGETGYALLLADRSVLCDAAFVSKLMDCSVAGLNDMIR